MTISVNVIVNGRIINKFNEPKTNKIFVEGRKGSDYTLRVYNQSSKRRKIVISVDGLNVMTGDSTWDRGYVVEGYKSLDVPGWRLNKDKIQKFIFSAKTKSYNNLMDE